MISFARFRGIATVALAVLAAMVVLDVVLRASTGPAPASLRERVHLASWDIEGTGRRIAGITRSHRAAAGPRWGLGVIVGLSTAEAGINPRILEAEAGGGLRWASVTGLGGGFEKVLEMVRLIRYAEPKPEIVILGTNPHGMVEASASRDEKSPPQAVAELKAAVAARSPLNAAKAVRDLVTSESWVLHNRPRTSLIAKIGLYLSRIRVADGLGVDIGAIFDPDPTPWHDSDGYPPKEHWPPIRTPRLLSQVWPSWGIYDPRSFDADGLQAHLLAETIAAIRQTGATPVVVLMPESSVLRERIPVAAVAAMNKALARAFAPEQADVIDLRTAVPDDEFSDPMHADKRGCTRASHIIAERLREIRARRPST